VDRAAHGGDDGLGLEDVELLLADAEADRAGDPVAVHERGDDEDALEDLALAGREGVLRGLGDDDLVGLAVDHQLPATLVDVAAVGVLPDRQAPLLEQVDGAVDVTRDAGHEILAADTHQVVADVVHVVLHRVLAVLEAHVLVDGGETHRHRTRAVHGGLVDERDLDAVLLGPVGRLDGRTTGRHSASTDQEVGLNRDGLEVGHP
jgi:hypothetical protein